MKIAILRIWAILPVLLFLCSKNLNAQGVSINPSGNPPDPSAIMDINSSSQGLLIPRMSSSQRDAISSPAEGLQIFNTTTKCYESYVYDYWQSVWCGQCPAVSSPTAATHVGGPQEISWNWNAVAGADGYKWNNVNNYSTATDNGTSTTYLQSGLECDTPYQLYVWSYTTCGAVSPVLVLSESTIYDVSCFVQATGGTVTTNGNYKVHTFTSSGNFTVSNGGLVEYLVVGGGGGGGFDDGGGGGAGGFLTGTGFAVTPQAYNIVVGNGGAGGTDSQVPAPNGQSSVFSTIVALGGGGGGSASPSGASGSNGGSGGGIRDRGGVTAWTPGLGTAGQGNDGGADGEGSSNQCGSGGGGAGAPGAVSGLNAGGNGGAGLSSSISGSLQYYAGGGGGGAEGGPGTPGNGGIGGGGSGGGPNNAGSSATPNTGGGGGGGSGGSVRTGGNGGSGIVIIRYLFQ